MFALGREIAGYGQDSRHLSRGPRKNIFSWGIPATISANFRTAQCVLIAMVDHVYYTVYAICALNIGMAYVHTSDY